MITGTKPNEPRISEKTRKDYYVLMDDGIPVGVCSEKDAHMCIMTYAEKKSAYMYGLNVYVYADEHGPHLITLRVVPKMKMAR